MSSSPRPRETDEVALRDLLVGEPAVNRVLDGDAARAKAEQLVRDVGSDPRVADVVGRIGDGNTSQPDLDESAASAGASVRADAEGASEIQRNTQRLHPSRQVTAPKLDVSPGPNAADPHAIDPHRRVTDPRLHQRGPSDDAADDAYLAAQVALHQGARRARADHQRLVILGASALAVGIILLAFVFSGRDKSPPPAAPTTDPTPTGQIPVDTTPVDTAPAHTAPPSTAPVETVLIPAPSAPASGATATPPAPTAPATTPGPLPRESARPPGVETNPKSSAPRPGPGQDAPVPQPKPSSDRPF